jgi:excisionase family DNA binding protein
MRSTTAPKPFRAKHALVLRGVYEKSARSVISAVRRATPKKASTDVITDLVDSLTGVIEQSTQLLLAGKQVRVIEDDDAMTTQEAADLLNVSRPHLVKLLETGQIPQLPRAGRHRRVARTAVLKYKRGQQAQRESALKELAAISQQHKLGY